MPAASSCPCAAHSLLASSRHRMLHVGARGARRVGRDASREVTGGWLPMQRALSGHPAPQTHARPDAAPKRSHQPGRLSMYTKAGPLAHSSFARIVAPSLPFSAASANAAALIVNMYAYELLDQGVAAAGRIGMGHCGCATMIGKLAPCSAVPKAGNCRRARPLLASVVRRITHLVRCCLPGAAAEARTAWCMC